MTYNPKNEESYVSRGWPVFYGLFAIFCSYVGIYGPMSLNDALGVALPWAFSIAWQTFVGVCLFGLVALGVKGSIPPNGNKQSIATWLLMLLCLVQLLTPWATGVSPVLSSWKLLDQHLLPHYAAQEERQVVPAEVVAQATEIFESALAKQDCQALKPLVLDAYTGNREAAGEYLEFLDAANEVCLQVVILKKHLRKSRMTPTKPLYPLGNPA